MMWMAISHGPITRTQLSSELNEMKGIVPDDILEALKKKKLGLPGIDTDPLPEKNALVMGEFNVIKALIEKHPEAKFAKAQVRAFRHPLYSERCKPTKG